MHALPNPTQSSGSLDRSRSVHCMHAAVQVAGHFRLLAVFVRALCSVYDSACTSYPRARSTDQITSNTARLKIDRRHKNPVTCRIRKRLIRIFSRSTSDRPSIQGLAWQCACTAPPIQSFAKNTYYVRVRHIHPTTSHVNAFHHHRRTPSSSVVHHPMQCARKRHIDISC
jgi:hypothetical protein